MKLVNWNVEWATPRSKRSSEIVKRIDRHSPEIVCLTETHPELLKGGHAVGAHPGYGYGIRKDRRKVLLWSREPWKRVDAKFLRIWMASATIGCRRDGSSLEPHRLPKEN